MTRTVRIELATIMAVVLALMAYSRIREHRESPQVERRTAQVTEEATTPEGSAAAQTTEGAPGSGDNPISKTSTGRQGAPGAKGSRSGESLPEGSTALGFEIAFNRGWDIHVMDSEGTDLRKLRTGAEPGWSHDGKLIAFYGGSDGDDIQVMRPDGSALQSLQVTGFYPTWSPDGGQVAFGRDCHGHQSDGVCSADGSSWATNETEDCGPECGIGVVARDGSGVRHLGNGIWPEWGPDGRIIFADGIPTGPCTYGQSYWMRGIYWDGEDYETLPPCELPIWVMNHDGSGRTRLPIDKAIKPTWSIDGRKIAYSTATDGVFIANSDGTAIKRVAPEGFMHPSWSPDGFWLGLTRAQGGDYSIYLRAIDGSAERRLTPGPYDVLPSFSPRG